MDIYPLFFLLIFAVGSLAALSKGPIWGLLLYVFVYFNIPSQQWWGNQVPDLRWSLLTVGVLLVSCFLHSRQLTAGNWSGNAPLKTLVLLLLLMIAIVPVSFDPHLSWGKVYDFFRYVLVFYLIGRIVSDFEKYQKYVLGLIFCSFYLFWLAHHYFRGQRLDGVGLPDASDANMLAALILLILPLMAAVFLTGKKWQKMAVLAGTPFALNTFVMCGSRGAFVGLLVQLVLAVFLLRNNPHRRKLIAGVAVIAVLLTALMDDKYKSRLLGLQESIAEGQAAENSAGRADIWKAGLGVVSDYPFGAGGGAFMVLSPDYIPEHLIEKSVGQRASHNTYLLILVEAGILGLLLYLAFITFTLLAAVRALRMQRVFGAGRDEGKMVALHCNALILSLAGFWAAAFFIDRIYFEGIYLVAAFAPALQSFAKNVEQAPKVRMVEEAVPA